MNFKEKEYRAFDMFDRQWALATAGTIDDYNSCTISWGSLGNIWADPGKGRPIVTIYIHPARYTLEFLKKNNYFTVAFFPSEYRKALGYMGSHSGRDGDKAAAAGLTPVSLGESVTYDEAKLTFLCRKLYQHKFEREDLAKDVQEYYASQPKVYPDFKGGWQPHFEFIGEVIDVKEK